MASYKEANATKEDYIYLMATYLVSRHVRDAYLVRFQCIKSARGIHCMTSLPVWYCTILVWILRTRQEVWCL